MAVMLDGAVLAEATADAAGAFVAFVALPPSETPRVLGLQVDLGDGPVIAENYADRRAKPGLCPRRRGGQRPMPLRCSRWMRWPPPIRPPPTQARLWRLWQSLLRPKPADAVGRDRDGYGPDAPADAPPEEATPAEIALADAPQALAAGSLNPRARALGCARGRCRCAWPAVAADVVPRHGAGAALAALAPPVEGPRAPELDLPDPALAQSTDVLTAAPDAVERAKRHRHWRRPACHTGAACRAGQPRRPRPGRSATGPEPARLPKSRASRPDSNGPSLACWPRSALAGSDRRCARRARGRRTGRHRWAFGRRGVGYDQLFAAAR